MTEQLNKITYLSDAQYNELKNAGELNENQLYCTPDNSSSAGSGEGGGSDYVLPIASKDVLGGIKVGANLTIDEDGTLNAQAGGGSDATIAERNIMVLQTSDVHRVQNGEYVKFNRVKCSIGDKLSYVEGTRGITIGKGVSKIFVSFTINICSSARQWFMLRRSKENTGICCMGKSGADNYTTLCIAPALLFVKEGDLIEVASQSSGAGTVNQDLGTTDPSYMTVEVLE